MIRIWNNMSLLYSQASKAGTSSLRTKKPSPPGHTRSSGYHSDSVLMGLTRQLSTDSSIHELEEEKVQQLRNVSDLIILLQKVNGVGSIGSE